MRNLGTILAAAAASVLGAVLLPACMGDPMSGGAGTYDGPVSLTLNLGFDPLAESLATRGVAANLDFELRDLALFFYDGNADEQTPPVKTYSFTDLRTEQAERVSKDGVDPHTRRTSVTLDDIASGSYRIYAAANVAETLADNGISDLSLLSESALRGLTVTWAPYAEDAGEDEQSPLRYAIPDAMYGFFDNGDEQEVIGKRAPVIALASKSVTLHAWLKRVVSRLTVGFDGSQLNDGVAIYIKSVRVRDAVAASPLGENNKAETERDLFSDTRTDPRLNHVWSPVEGAADAAITNSTPAFPRPAGKDGISTRSDDGIGWNADWYEYVHGNAKTLDPAGPVDENTPVALYFMENMQGTGTKIARDDDPMGETYKKDEKPLGTYVEVSAHYKNQTEENDIIYRFMLGQNITDDFNVERNRHYKLTLRFKGDANNPDWHIEYPAMPYFRIPDEEQWKLSWVWHAYNDAGEPIAEMAREMVYIGDDDDWKKRTYYQIVTVYPVMKNTNQTGKYKYTTDLSRGMIAQVLTSDNKDITNNSLMAGGTLSIYLRTQPNVKRYDSGKVGYAFGGRYAIKEITDGKEPDYYYVNVLSEDYTVNVKGKVTAQPTGEESYVYKDSDEEYTYKKIYNLKLGVQKDWEYRIRPYRPEDESGNTYPVVKIGSAYWLRENLRATQWDNGQKVYPYNLSKQGGSWHELIVSGSPGSEYDYDFGPVQTEDPDVVDYFERWPMYKVAGKAYLYNYMAASAIDIDVDAFDNSEDTYADPWVGYYPVSGGLFNQLVQQGYIDSDYSDFEISKESDTAELFSEKDYSGMCNNRIAPEGWHLPSDLGYRMDSYGAIDSDVFYLEEYFGNTWERAMSDDSEFGVWPQPQNSKLTKKNLSGLSLLPIPIDWEAEGFSIQYDVADDGLYQKATDGVVVPFWTDVLLKRNGYSYPHPPFVQYYNDKKDDIALVCNASGASEKYCLDVTKSYLPIRCVRNSNDYSVGTIGDRNSEPNIDRF